MADILLDVQSAPATPSAGQAVMFIDTNTKTICVKDDAGVVSGRYENGSTAAQTANAADTYLTDSDVKVPTFGFQAKMMYRWLISVSKTAAGLAGPVFSIRIGTNRTTADTARLTLTGPAQTAAADVGEYEIILIVRSVSATGVIQGSLFLKHNGAAVGLANNDASGVEGTSAAFDNTALAGQFIGISVNPGASGVWTITQVRVEAKW